MTVGEKIKKARLEAGLTQKQLAEKCGMQDSAIRRYENNSSACPKYQTLVRIASAFTELTNEVYVAGDFLADDFAVSNENFFDVRNDALNRIKGEEDFVNSVAKMGYDFTNPKQLQLISSFSKLNDEGQSKAVERVNELTEIKKYVKVHK